MKNKSSLFLQLFLVVLISSVVAPAAAQIDSAVNYPNLLLPRFTKSVVKLKSGVINTAVLNYNTVEQEMVFMQDKLFYVLDDPHLVDSVFMANRTFVPMEKGFYEVLYKAPVTLFKQHKSYAEFEGYPTGYGVKSKTTSPNYVRQIYGTKGAINLKIPQNFKVVDDSQYWIRVNYDMKPFDNKRLFLKVFPQYEKELNEFINKNRIDFKKPADVVRLIQYCNELLN